jgi:pyrroloquinoline quinone (PQQ) biosynthesis protein C
MEARFMAGKNFDAFKHTIERDFMGHPVVKNNEYTAWFADGDVTINHLRQFTVQFSVFSNQFLLAALNRVINADTLHAARESKEILMNELGVIYNKPGASAGSADRHSQARPSTHDREGDPALVATEGTVDGGKFRFQAAHFEWLLRFGEPLGLSFDDMGKRRHGIPTTLHFCDELFRLYGSDDYNEAMGASFAVENWAAAGFWKELIAGLERVKAQHVPDLPLAFFTWHDKIEDQHREHTWDELRECYDSAKFREEPFIRAGVKMLDGVKVFWDGLNDLRKHPRARVA